MMQKIRLVIATRHSADDFFGGTPLGQMLSLMPVPHVDVRLFPKNQRGLPEVYNQAIDESGHDPALLVFMHDDVCFLDFWWWEQVAIAGKKFDIAGLAGNKRRVPFQPSWAFIDRRLTWDDQKNLSGVVAHGSCFPPSTVSIYGPPGQQVKLLDGLLLISNSETLIQAGLRFDERFRFHFYDMDFCRVAELKGLVMGTWAISVIHQSGGNFGSEWNSSLELYLKKWKS